MARISRSISYKNAVISKKDGTITEITKDDCKVYSLEQLINDWDGIEGVSITFKKDDDLEEYDEAKIGEDE